ncbi:hypothetical protein A3D00_00125 [Candidatus Woesebacteria bacterium RIFCSPHIGHO2_02_FULL_38_9]|nr:MAG: hypothetical protein A3D00_00125 [Candidatus Woesebacteria bacterium RIFCSPHIGHO2_02_FULL_38_9]OGM57848.1 MAG: hypothetical protein A3A50_02435 [Candidatus Woesebacteria bacterium RIFCSPLOWO2_01_FULL_38_20]
MEKKSIFIKNISLFFLFIFVGIMVHYPSFKFSLYGDDWMHIFNYFNRQNVYSNFGPLPGILSFLTPYGPSIFMIGHEYELFGKIYFLYYVVSLFLRIFATYSLFMVCQRITKSLMNSLLTSILFLVGFTGIQTTDWAVFSNIYLALGIYFLSLFYYAKYYENGIKKDSLISTFLLVIAMILAPVRFYPVIVIVPFLDVMIYLKNEKKKVFGYFLKKNVFFVILVILFWIIGVFGAPGKIYSPGDWTTGNFISIVNNQPLLIMKSFLYWSGVIIIPDNIVGNHLIIERTGLFILITIFITLLVSIRRKQLVNVFFVIITVFFLIFLSSIWYYSPTRLIGSPDRYLMVVFGNFCLLGGIFVSAISKRFRYLKFITLLTLVYLVLLQTRATRSIYAYWLLKGRDSNFMRKVEKVISPNLAMVKNDQSIIYLDFDDNATLQSVQFGLGFKMLVFSNTWNKKYLPVLLNQKLDLLTYINDKVKSGISKDVIIADTFSYQYKGGNFIDNTKEVRIQLKNVVIENK